MSEQYQRKPVSEYTYPKVVEKYAAAVSEIGLWNSEEIIFSRYINAAHRILDVGCGAGRTTFSLFARGYHNITGIDLSDQMIAACDAIKNANGADIEFLSADATRLPFADAAFDACIFSFNGLMTIPMRVNRLAAMKEICRVLKTGGRFIFTTHDINNPQFAEYWQQEQLRWEKGVQDPNLHEYGDLLFSKPEDYGDAISFVHVPPDGEIEDCLDEAGLHLIYSALRADICDEKDSVKEFAVECRFRVAEKK